MNNINVRDARNTFGDLVKGAHSGHPLSALDVAPIKQGADGWNKDRIWPIFVEIAKPLGASTKEEAVVFTQNLIRSNGVDDTLSFLSAVPWAQLVSVSSTPTQTPTVFVTPLPTPEVATPNPKTMNAATPPSGSTSAMRAMLETLAASVQEAEKEEANVHKEVAQLRSDMEALAEDLGDSLREAVANVAKVAKESDAPLNAATLRGAVAAALKELSPTENEVGDAVVGARELPDVKTPSPYYIPPSWAEDVAQFISADMNGVIGGSSGAGKTFPLVQICAALGRPCKVISASGGMTAETLVSEPQMKGGTSFYADGALLHAMRHGYVLIVDEGDSIETDEALVFNDPIESRRITNPNTGEVVEATAGFCVWFTSNSLGDNLGIYNRVGFDESLKQRLLQVVAHPMTLQEEVSILLRLESPSGDKLSEGEADLLCKWAHAARPLHFGVNGNDSVLSSLPSTRILIQAAEVYLGFNSKTGAAFKPLKGRVNDVRQSLWHTFAATCSPEDIEALKNTDLWIW